jgi:hypothetical protein
LAIQPTARTCHDNQPRGPAVRARLTRAQA